MSNATLDRGAQTFSVRPSFKKLHTFRSKVVSMSTFSGRIFVVLESGKCYRSNGMVTRWYKINPA